MFSAPPPWGRPVIRLSVTAGGRQPLPYVANSCNQSTPGLTDRPKVGEKRPSSRSTAYCSGMSVCRVVPRMKVRALKPVSPRRR